MIEHDKKLIGLVVTNIAGSGAERVVLNLAEMFLENGHQAYIFLLENNIQYELSPLLHGKVIALTQDRSFHKLFSKLGDKFLSKILMKEIHSAESYEGKSFDMIISHLPSADRVCHFLPNQQNLFYCIHTSYSLEIAEFHKRGKHHRANKKGKLYKSLYVDKKLICVSDNIIKDINSMQIAYKSIHRIYNPFNFDNIHKLANAEISSQFENKEPYVLSASAYRPVKRHDILLKAYKKSNIDIPLYLLCHPENELLKLIDDLKLNKKVKILGFQKNPYPIIKNAEILILSSEREGLPTVLIESLILNTPVVSTNCISGPSEILTGKQAYFLANVNDIDDLSLKLSTLLSSNLNEVKAQDVLKFSQSRILDEYLSLCNGSQKVEK